MRLAGSFGSTIDRDPGTRAIPGYILLSVDSIVKLWTVPCGTPGCTCVSGDGACVGPITKLPIASAGGTAPSGSSVACTYPGVCGSRVGAGLPRPRAGGAAGVVVAGVVAPGGVAPGCCAVEGAGAGAGCCGAGAFWAIAAAPTATNPTTIAMLNPGFFITSDSCPRETPKRTMWEARIIHILRGFARIPNTIPPYAPSPPLSLRLRAFTRFGRRLPLDVDAAGAKRRVRRHVGRGRWARDQARRCRQGVPAV